MTIFRTEHKRNYTVTNNFITKDNRLSWKAKGIWLYAFSRPDDWEFHLNDIINHSTDGRDAVRAGLKELEDTGYLQREQKRDNGQYSKAEWVFFETPQEIKKCLPKTENPTSGNPTSENPPLLSTDNSLLPNIDKQQQGATPPAAAVPLKKKISNSLELIAIPEADKIEITDTYKDSIIKDAVGWAMQQSERGLIKKTLAAAIKFGCARALRPEPSKESMAGENKSWAKQFDGLENDRVRVDALNHALEFVFLQGQRSPNTIEYTHKDFKELVCNHISTFNL